MQIQQYYDFLVIDGFSYNGMQQVHQVVPSSFNVTFHSDESITSEGFVLQWTCTDGSATAPPTRGFLIVTPFFGHDFDTKFGTKIIEE